MTASGNACIASVGAEAYASRSAPLPVNAPIPTATMKSARPNVFQASSALRETPLPENKEQSRSKAQRGDRHQRVADPRGDGEDPRQHAERGQEHEAHADKAPGVDQHQPAQVQSEHKASDHGQQAVERREHRHRRQDCEQESPGGNAGRRDERTGQAGARALAARNGLRRSPCPIANTLDLVGDKWSLLVIRDLLAGRQTFGELLASPEGIPTNILAERLRRFEAAGLIESALYQERPARYAYALTSRGQALRHILNAFIKWGRHFLPGTMTLDELDLGAAGGRNKRRPRRKG